MCRRTRTPASFRAPEVSADDWRRIKRIDEAAIARGRGGDG